jgi:hypothetical protein
MDAASYAAQRQQMDAAKLQQLMQMFMAAKQNQQDQGWQREQFAYRQQQDAADNARSAAYQKAQEEYYKGSLANQERTAARLEAKAEEESRAAKKKEAMDAYLKMFPQAKDEKWDSTREGYIDKKRIDKQFEKPDKPEKGPDVVSNQRAFIKESIAAIDNMSKAYQDAYKAAVANGDEQGKQDAVTKLGAITNARRELAKSSGRLTSGKPISPDEWGYIQDIASTPLDYKPAPATQQAPAPGAMPTAQAPATGGIPSFQEAAAEVKRRTGKVLTAEEYKRAVERMKKK